MKKKLLAGLVAVLSLVIANPVQADSAADLDILQRAYPGAFEIVDNGQAIEFPNGRRLIYDDGREKSFDELLEEPDLEDMMSLDYPLGEVFSPPGFQNDPGRFRPDPFFRGLYGETESDVRANLRPVRWGPDGPWFQVTTRFGVADALVAVIAELWALPPEFLEYLLDPGGSFNYRTIAGTERVSMHGFGIAVDIAVGPANYWRWEPAGASVYRNRVPYEIVEIFEAHGFIWGGKWYHFDTMHFEYRPELLLKAQARPAD